MQANPPIAAVWTGQPHPLGATWDGAGVNFALFSAHAEKVELCLFDPSGAHELQRIELKARTDDIWHCYLPQAGPGTLYGYRVHGPYRPHDGHRFNPHKLLIDPYARSLACELRWSDAHFAYRIGHEQEDLSFDRQDDAPGMPKCRVIDSSYEWAGDQPPKVPWQDTVIYELHVKGFTMHHPGVPPELRGTYAGLASPEAIRYLRQLGVTTVELMPVHAFAQDRHLVDKGLSNYWGYNSLAFFAPEPRYAATGQISEFKTMVRALHAAGIEVILDVVYNHTAEGNHMGPTLSLRGIDNATYYRLVPGDRRYYMDFTGCGNTLCTANPPVLELIRASLRYWVDEMHVDGFRFDLAPALARGAREVEMRGAFFEVIARDPVLSQVKMIAEPWDLGHGGYRLGGFPNGWAEWNDRYRDTVRAFWKADGASIGELATRLTGSSDLYESNGRKPHASINLVTAHDGFTLQDLVSYNHKHNHANREGNRDGGDHNLSWNCGTEGITDDPAVNALRRRQKRNLLATLFLSQGVPMLLAGDEMGRTQRGNNNAYCQDNEISWLNWSTPREDRDLLQFVQRLIALRREHPVLRRGEFFQGRPVRANGVKDIMWFSPDGREMNAEAWRQPHARCLGIQLAGNPPPQDDDNPPPPEPCPQPEQGPAKPWRRLLSRVRGWFGLGARSASVAAPADSPLNRFLESVTSHPRETVDGSFLILVNAHHETVPFVIPGLDERVVWSPVFDTDIEGPRQANAVFEAGGTYALKGRSVVLLSAAHRGSFLAGALARVRDH